MPSNRQAFFVALTVFLTAVIFLLALHNSVSPLIYRLANPEESIGYIHKPDKYASVGQGHLVSAEIWSYREALIVRAEIHFRQKGAPEFSHMKMDRIGTSVYFAAIMPAQQKGQIYEYYITAQDSFGDSVFIPEAAPNGPIPSVQWRSNVNLWLVLLQLVFLLGSGIYLMHGIYYALLIVFGRQGELAQKATAGRAYAALRWGWLALLLGGIPLSIYVTGITIGWLNCWSPWPAGADIDDTRTLYLLIFFGVILILRLDLFRFSPTAKRAPWLSNRIFGWLILAGAMLALLSYLIPYAYVYR